MAVSNRTRFLIGGIGGLAPIVALLTVVDIGPHVIDMTYLKAAGHIVKVVALFMIGGFIAWLHESEDKHFKIFEIGLGAPALIAGVIATNTVSQSIIPTAPTKSHQPAAVQTVPPQKSASNTPVWEFIFPTAHAQTAQGKPQITTAAGMQAPSTPASPATTQATITKRFAPPPQSAASQFVEGLVGIQPAKRWYVIAGSYVRPENAAAFANDMNKKNTSIRAEVYAPSEGKQFYGIVLGADLTSEEALALRDRAMKAGFPADTYIKSFATLR